MGSKIIAANWKMNLSPQEAKRYFEEWVTYAHSTKVDVIFFVPAYCWQQAAEFSVAWGPQHVYCEEFGAYTGENSPKVAWDMGARWVLIGHSERRHLFGEGEELIRKKFYKTMEIGLKPVLCVGETWQQRESGDWDRVLENQLQSVLQGFDQVRGTLTEWVVAYEPVWAIGTGKVPSEGDIERAHFKIKNVIEKRWGLPAIPVLYGGSVNVGNASTILKTAGVDGLLVGGASLIPSQFYRIVQSS
ncbi:MAG: triose-phosphate isomerase [Bdellovibrionaceae bacterium]|nr:triose-phosphate isomerase [Pseudobdellovibrionaceae bacterium]